MVGGNEEVSLPVWPDAIDFMGSSQYWTPSVLGEFMPLPAVSLLPKPQGSVKGL